MNDNDVYFTLQPATVEQINTEHNNILKQKYIIQKKKMTMQGELNFGLVWYFPGNYLMLV